MAEQPKPIGFIPKWLKDMPAGEDDNFAGNCSLSDEDLLPRKTVEVYWWPSEQYPEGLSYTITDDQLAEHILSQGVPCGLRVDRGTETLVHHYDELYNIEKYNIGADAAAQGILNYIKGGPSHKPAFGCDKMNEICRRFAELQEEVTRLRAAAS